MYHSELGFSRKQNILKFRFQRPEQLINKIEKMKREYQTFPGQLLRCEIRDNVAIFTLIKFGYEISKLPERTAINLLQVNGYMWEALSKKDVLISVDCDHSNWTYFCFSSYNDSLLGIRELIGERQYEIVGYEVIDLSDGNVIYTNLTLHEAMELTEQR